MASFTIRSATEADGPAIAEVHHNALAKYYKFYAAFFARNPRETLPLSTANALKKPEFIFLVAVDDISGSILGFIRYQVIAGKAAAAALLDHNAATHEIDVSEAKEPPGPLSSSLFAPKEHMKELWDRFNEKQADMDACYEKAVNGAKHIYINHLMIDPAHQRRGIGSKLVKTVLAVADEAGIATHLVSSAESRSMYAKVGGFESLKSWTVDNGYWAREVARLERELGIFNVGNEGEEGELERAFEGVTEVEDCMVRQPRGGCVAGTWKSLDGTSDI